MVVVAEQRQDEARDQKEKPVFETAADIQDLPIICKRFEYNISSLFGIYYCWKCRTEFVGHPVCLFIRFTIYIRNFEKLCWPRYMCRCTQCAHTINNTYCNIICIGQWNETKKKKSMCDQERCDYFVPLSFLDIFIWNVRNNVRLQVHYSINNTIFHFTLLLNLLVEVPLWFNCFVFICCICFFLLFLHWLISHILDRKAFYEGCFFVCRAMFENVLYASRKSSVYVVYIIWVHREDLCMMSRMYWIFVYTLNSIGVLLLSIGGCRDIGKYIAHYVSFFKT